MTAAAEHLSELELVDLLDGTLTPIRRAHLATCAACARQAEELAGILRSANVLDVPEPPPFFWTQFSAKLRERIGAEPSTPAGLIRRLRAPAFAVAAAAVIAAGVMLRPSTPGTAVNAPRTAVEQGVAAGDLEAVATEDLDGDEAWALVRSIAEDMEHDEMDSEGISPGPGAIERLALQLTEAERIELARLLDEELRGRRAPGSAS